MATESFADVVKEMPQAVRVQPASMGDLYDYVQLLMKAVTELKAEVKAGEANAHDFNLSGARKVAARTARGAGRRNRP